MQNCTVTAEEGGGLWTRIRRQQKTEGLFIHSLYALAIVTEIGVKLDVCESRAKNKKNFARDLVHLLGINIGEFSHVGESIFSHLDLHTIFRNFLLSI